MLELGLTLPLPAFTLEVSLRTEARAVALLGASGAGKTSLLEAVAGLRRGARGRVAVNGALLQDGVKGLPPEARGVGYVPQELALFPHLSAGENVAFGARGAGEVRRWTELLGIDGLLGRRVSGLSGGERQRVALARALCARPALLLLDEPLSSVDLPLRERLLPLLGRAVEESGARLLYVTHSPDEAAALCTEAAWLREGKVAARGSVAEVVAAWRASAAA